jgi:hypothetical protein
MQHANFPLKLWDLAMRTSVYFRNHFPTHGASGGGFDVPFTFPHGKPVDPMHMKVFKCFANLRMKD